MRRASTLLPRVRQFREGLMLYRQSILDGRNDENLRTDLNITFGDLKNDLDELGISRQWEQFGRRFPVYETALLQGRGRQDSVKLDALRFAIANLEPIIGALQRMVAEGDVVPVRERHRDRSDEPPASTVAALFRGDGCRMADAELSGTGDCLSDVRSLSTLAKVDGGTGFQHRFGVGCLRCQPRVDGDREGEVEASRVVASSRVHRRGHHVFSDGPPRSCRNHAPRSSFAASLTAKATDADPLWGSGGMFTSSKDRRCV
jgi:hypothetical protein